jgi:hypothetical protein
VITWDGADWEQSADDLHTVYTHVSEEAVKARLLMHLVDCGKYRDTLSDWFGVSYLYEFDYDSPIDVQSGLNLLSRMPSAPQIAIWEGLIGDFASYVVWER